MDLLRLQCPACSTIVRIPAATAKQHPVVRCAKCHGLVSTASSHVTNRPAPRAEPRRPRRPSLRPQPGLILAVVLGLIGVVAAVVLYGHFNHKDHGIFPNVHFDADEPLAAPPRARLDLPKANSDEQPSNPPAAPRQSKRSWRERYFEKLLELTETTSALLSAAFTPADIYAAFPRCKALLEEFNRLESERQSDDEPADAARDLARIARLAKSYELLKLAFARIQADPALAKAFAETFDKIEFPNPDPRANGRSTKRTPPRD